MTPTPPTATISSNTSQSTNSSNSSNKPIHSLVLDTGPLIKNDPSVSELIAKAEKLYTIPSIISEIRDPATRMRVESMLLPFVIVRAPGPASVKFVTDFVRRTGDLAVLSRPDIEVIALSYELECERNNGDWRLRNTPGQKKLNGRQKSDEEKQINLDGLVAEGESDDQVSEPAGPLTTGSSDCQSLCEALPVENALDRLSLETSSPASEYKEAAVKENVETNNSADTMDAAVTSDLIADDDDSDEDGWITPSNLEKHKAQDSHSSTPSQPMQKTLQAAILTSDYAMQNVALRINLNLITPSFSRIIQLKNWVLRCHGCFSITKDMEKRFCPKCGQPTLTRTSCSTDPNGNFQIHLKRNFQWNNRGNVYSVPKAVHGSANGRLPKGQGGQNGWGRELILAEDQKEFVKAADEQRRQRKKDLMGDDYLPGILSGKRSGQAGKIRVGAGKNVNSRRKH